MNLDRRRTNWRDKVFIECLELTIKESDDIKYDYYLEVLYVEGIQQIWINVILYEKKLA